MTDRLLAMHVEGSTNSGSQLDLTGAALASPSTSVTDLEVKTVASEEAPPIVLPHQEMEYVEHIAIDIGGSLIKLVYMSRDSGSEGSGEEAQEGGDTSFDRHNEPSNTGGRLHFVKFQTTHLDECMEFMRFKGLHLSPNGRKMRVKATGGGAYKFADAFKEKIGLVVEREDELECIVEGANFLLKTLRFEAFTYIDGKQDFVESSLDNQLFPYLLVNIGSGVSIVKVDGENQFERVSGTNLGGGTFWGLCRLLTRCKGFDEMLELARHGDNSKVDMLVGDIYGGADYAKAGLSAATIASSFGKAAVLDKDLEEYDPADIALALCRMVSYNIGQLAFLNAQRYGVKRIYFGGFFIRGSPYTMETISFAIRFWSKGEQDALFLRHEGFLGCMGAFLKTNPIAEPMLARESSCTIKSKFLERFRMGAPFVGGKVQGAPISDVAAKVDWVEKFVQVGKARRESVDEAPLSPLEHRQPISEMTVSPRLQLDLHVGVLHYEPYLEPFPMLSDPQQYEPNTIDISDALEERDYWLGVLEEQVPTYVRKAASSQGLTADAQRRADAFGMALSGHFKKLREEPTAYGKLGLADLFELREDCLREFKFTDAYKLDKSGENEVALQVLPDLLEELDSMEPEARLLSLIEGVLAANIFDWGAKACIDLYNSGTILDIYRKARSDLANRPWRVDTFDSLKNRWFEHKKAAGKPFRRVILFVDNAGADIVLGMIPLAREILMQGGEVVMVANASPAINDMTASEVKHLMKDVAALCPVVYAARRAAIKAVADFGGRIPPPGAVASPSAPEDGSSPFSESAEARGEPRLYVMPNGQGSPCLDLRRVPAELADAAMWADLVVIEGMGRAIHTNLHTRFRCDSLKLAMVKNKRVAEKLFNGNIYDCVCLFEEGVNQADASGSGTLDDQ